MLSLEFIIKCKSSEQQHCWGQQSDTRAGAAMRRLETCSRVHSGSGAGILFRHTQMFPLHPYLHSLFWLLACVVCCARLVLLWEVGKLGYMRLVQRVMPHFICAHGKRQHIPVYSQLAQRRRLGGMTSGRFCWVQHHVTIVTNSCQ